MAGPSEINKPYAEASHTGDGVPNKATAVNQPAHIAAKKESLQQLHRDPNHSPDAIANRATGGKKGGSGTAGNWGNTISSTVASHGSGGQGKHSHSVGGDNEAVSKGTKYPDGSTSLASHPDVPLSPSLVSIDSQRLV
ncbi:unnamed protein product [Sympodiomycopsis kandeliae]